MLATGLAALGDDGTLALAGDGLGVGLGVTDGLWLGVGLTTCGPGWAQVGDGDGEPVP